MFIGCEKNTGQDHSKKYVMNPLKVHIFVNNPNKSELYSPNYKFREYILQNYNLAVDFMGVKLTSHTEGETLADGLRG
jgi:hypothetical protein